jgi:SNF2 family DNA or RNA helicase
MLRRTKEDKLGEAIPSKRVLTGGQTAGQISWLAPVMNGSQRDTYDEVIKKVSAARAGGRLMEVLLPSLMALRNISLHPALGKKDGIHLPQNIHEAEEFIKESAKLQAMIKALQEIRTRGEKVIIFVINRTLQGVLATSLAQIFKLDTVSVINGETKAVSSKKDGSETRKSLIKDFESKPGFGIIIMSPLAAGVGITVTGANNVIHLERHWNPAKEAQASDRVYRIGQKKDVNIYIPILEHPEKVSFDRNLDQLLQHKIDLKDAVVTPGDIKAEDFDMENLLGV